MPSPQNPDPGDAANGGPSAKRSPSWANPFRLIGILVLAHPVGFWFIFWGELAERSSFYGMRTILGLYLKHRMGFSEQSASVLVALFQAAVYVLPIAGGFIADRWLGKYRTIVLFSLPYVLGQFLMTQENLVCLYAALALLAMGSGVIKPNISPLMGMTYDQQRPGKTELRSQAFAAFYLAINIGAFLSTYALPLVREAYGSYAVAFLCPAVLMVVALGFFAAGKPFYAAETVVAKRTTPEERRQQWRVFLRLAGLFLLVPFFWAVFDQSPSTWTFFAEKYMDLHVGSWTFTPDQLQALNALFILILLPAMSVLWQALARIGIRLRPTDKMIIGFVLAVLTTLVMAGAGFLATPENKVSIYWQVTAYVFITAAEVCISPVGLELAFSAAPQSMKGFVTACWLAMVFLGNLLNVPIVPFYDKLLAPGPYFAALTGMLALVTLAFVFVARRFNRTAAESEGHAAPP